MSFIYGLLLEARNIGGKTGSSRAPIGRACKLSRAGAGGYTLLYECNVIPEAHRRQLAYWLFTVAGFVVLMVLIGGLTRLTDSGLSITEWQPIFGALPPPNAADWEIAFAKYREIPEYQLMPA